MNKLSAAVVGLGQVGQGYDYDSPDDSVILTHATALSFQRGFELIAGVDADPAQRERFEKKFSKPAYSGLEALKENHNPEVISLAVPTSMHFSIFNDALALHPKAIVCEKPVAENVEEAGQMIDAAESSNCAVSVNYLRRFNPAINKMKQLIESRNLGEIYKGTIWYTKGIKENGSHFIDLFMHLLGDVEEIRVLKPGRNWNDRDPEPDVLIRFDETDIYMLSGREERYSMGQFELIGTEGTVHYEDVKSLIIRYAQEDPVYVGYRSLGKQKEIENPGDRNIWFTYENLAEHLEMGAGLKSTLETATNTLKVVEEIIEKIDGK